MVNRALSRRGNGPGAVPPGCRRALERGNVVVLLAVCREFTRPDGGGDVQELLDHPAQSELHLFGSGSTAVTGADFSISASRTFMVWRRSATMAVSTERASRSDSNEVAAPLTIALACESDSACSWGGREPNGFERQEFNAVEFAYCGGRNHG